jgi:L-threonylcarbamoyladenylate synthase
MITIDIARAAAVLQAEGLVAIPTETVYGLAGNIYSEKAVRQIFATKQRPLFNPLIAHIGRAEALYDLAAEVPAAAEALARHCWPGPLTLLLPKKDTVPDLITAGKPTVAVRMPQHPTALALLQSLPFPVAAPSANPFGSISPTTAQHVEGYFGDAVLVLDGGPCRQGIESTIVGFTEQGPVIYRLGTITQATIESMVGPVQFYTSNNEAPEAPGMLLKHYSPATPTRLLPNGHIDLHPYGGQRIGLLLFNQPVDAPVAHQELLSPSGSLEEAAANLYAALHRLDKLGLDLILVQPLPNEGLGRSINDRLNRATA